MNDNNNNYQNPPSFISMVTRFAKESVEYLKQGAPNVSIEDYTERLNTCNECPHINKKHMKCNICGCKLEIKAKWKTTTCPDNPPRWKEQVYEQPENIDSHDPMISPFPEKKGDKTKAPKDEG